jgi:DNA-binding response OmpR family regulator
MGLLKSSLGEAESNSREQTMAGTSMLKRLFAKRTQSSNGIDGEVATGLAADVIEAGDFLIDVPARKATLRGRELDLTPAEFEVLVFLAGHPKSVVTPHTMLATNWTSGQVRQAEFLRALRSLTKKLDSAAGSSQRYIRTEPWIFYRFDPSSAA